LTKNLANENQILQQSEEMNAHLTFLESWITSSRRKVRVTQPTVNENISIIIVAAIYHTNK